MAGKKSLTRAARLSLGAAVLGAAPFASALAQENPAPENDEIVVIDNLRASSTIVTACAIGVKEVIPVDDDARAFAYRDAGDVIAGEADGVQIPGYDIGNSPVEIERRWRADPFERLVLKTTNLVPILMQLSGAVICSSLERIN